MWTISRDVDSPKATGRSTSANDFGSPQAKGRSTSRGGLDKMSPTHYFRLRRWSNPLKEAIWELSKSGIMHAMIHPYGVAACQYPPR